MQIQLTNTGKRYNRDWIFRQCTYTFHAGNSYAIIGPNGSGKSTLLQTIAGAINPSEGSIAFSVDGRPLTVDNFYQHIALVAPYLEVIEEMTATEFLQFHAAFKPLLPNITIAEIIAIIGLEKNANKQIRYYSSGMKQRIKLAQAIFSDTNVLLLDEPCTNLDVTGYKLYNDLISTYCSHKLIIVSSNDLKEYGFCKSQIAIADYK
ncbi:ATP-binding cassette domain-containing protein [Parasediminibacterium paludis]|uniref:ATP-binding cassette domain-containing protein n=1 Tax=Parasediminibacterium paludis TaxID=908966 RepID=A0ABV8PVW3_9BACT